MTQFEITAMIPINSILYEEINDDLIYFRFAGDRWEPVDVFDIRPGEKILVIDSAE